MTAWQGIARCPASWANRDRIWRHPGPSRPERVRGFTLLRSGARQGCRLPVRCCRHSFGLLFCVAAVRRGENGLQLRPQVFRQPAPLVVRVACQYRPFIGRYRIGSDVAVARQRDQRQAVQCLDTAALGRSRVPAFRFEVIAPDLLVKLAEMKLSLDTSPSGIRFPFDFELYDVALPEGFPLRGRGRRLRCRSQPPRRGR